METICQKLASEIGVSLSEEQVKKLMQFKEMLLEANQYMNLTGIVEEKEIILKHFIDSLTIQPYIEKGKKLIDVGTGAGFPGIPIKIAEESLQITLLDSLQKRLHFIESVIQQLALKEITTVHGRAEDIAQQDAFREQYDYVTARAVANLSTLAELCLPFLKVGGLFLCMKGTMQEELEDAQKAILVLGGRVEKVDQFVLPESDMERCIVLIRKVASTPKQYPRKAGTPAKNPIR